MSLYEEDGSSGAGKITTGDQTIVAATDDNHVVAFHTIPIHLARLSN